MSKPIERLTTEFEKLANAVRLDQLKPLIKGAAAIIQEDAERRAHGSIADSFLTRIDRASTVDALEAKIGTDKKHWYARFFDTGTKPHEIKAKNASVLADVRTGAFFGRVVRNHPGMAKDPLLMGAIEAVGEEASEFYAQGIDQLIQESFRG